MIFGSLCWRCKRWHSHVYLDKSKDYEEKYICINCKRKLEVKGDGKK